jgi:hypothetical protein
MENIAYTVELENKPSLIEWLAEFRVGILAQKKDLRAAEIMSTWTREGQPVDWKEFVKRKVVELDINSYL